MSQNTLTFFYGKKPTIPKQEAVAGKAGKAEPVEAVKAINTFATTGTESATALAGSAATPPVDEHIAAFYASLSPNERKAHEIAAKSLGTSYDVRRTHGFTRWLSKK
jgi:hypothetical protein